MKTITVQVGNSDNKLRQSEWSHFVEAVKLAIEETATGVHFFGGSPNWYPWQNAAWVFVCGKGGEEGLRHKLQSIRQSFHQKSLAWTAGDTEMI